MPCRYTYKGKTYEAHEFDDVLRAMLPADAAQFMPGVEAVPSAPFVGRTDAWVALALKRVIKIATDGGYDKVAFITGDQSAERYDLSKHIDRIHYEKADDGTYELVAFKTGSRDDSTGSEALHEDGITIQRVEELIGKEIAQKIADSVGEHIGGPYREWRELKNVDLKVGGAGMKAFYDSIVPKVANEVLKKVGGGRLTTINIGAQREVSTNEDDGAGGVIKRREMTGDTLAQPGFDITPEMEAAASGGLPMFDLQDGGRRRSRWFDATNRLQFAPGKWLFTTMGKLAAPLLSKFQLKPMDDALAYQMRRMKLDVQKAQETAIAVAGEMNKLSDFEREMVSDIIEQELDAGITPPTHAVRLAAAMQQKLSDQSRELVALGMLSQDAAERWDGKYLPRFYESKLRKKVADIWGDVVRRVTTRASAMRGIRGKHLKGRGMWEVVPSDELADWQALGWEVRDKDYKDGDAEVQVWRDYTREEREKMGEIRDAGFRFVLGYMQTQRDLALGRMFAGMAADKTISSRLEKENWVRVPDTIVEGTGVKRYGKLAGRYVPRDVMTHLSQIEEADSAVWRAYRKALGLWKEGKTSLNPVSHMNNIVSNLTMAHFAGVSYHRADKYIFAVKDFARKSPMITEAKDAGLFLGTISDAELFSALPKEMVDLVVKGDSATMRGASFVYNLMTFFLRKPMGAAYKAEDLFFRYVIYRDARSNGATPEEAVNWAQEFIFAYDDLPKGARLIRDIGIPFFSYTYKAAPALLHTALVYPWRFAAPAAVLWAANAAAYAIAVGDDEDDWYERLRKYLADEDYRKKAIEAEKLEREHLPPWLRGTTSLGTYKTVRLGTDELTKLPLFIDVSRFVPGGDIFDVSPNAGGLPLPQPITPNNPLFTIGVAMIGNKDLFTGKEVVDMNDTSAEAAQKRAEWMWRQLSPAITAGNGHWERGMNALAQATGGPVQWLPGAPESISKTYTGIGKDGLPVQPKHAIAQTFGVKIRPHDLEKSAAIEQSIQQKVIRDIDTELRRLIRLRAIGAISPKAFEGELEKAREKKKNLREGLTLEGAER